MAALAVPIPVSPNSESTYYGTVLIKCTKLNSVAEGKVIHAQIIKHGFEVGAFLGNCLVNMYSKCGSIKDARSVFDNMAQQNLVSWNVMIAGYAQQGFGEEALNLFEDMQWVGMMANEYTFCSFLKACATLTALEEGNQAHCHIVKLGVQQNIFMGSALVDMYGKCSSIDDAHKAFERLSERNVVSWNAMIAAYVQCGQMKDALKLFSKMLTEGIRPSHVTFGFVLKACSSLQTVEQGKQLHACVFKSGFGLHLFVVSAVILMYMKCGSIDCGRQLFDGMNKVDVGLYNATIQGYADREQYDKAMEFFCQLLRTGMKPNEITLAIVFKSCQALDEAKQLHAYFIKSVYRGNVSLVSAVVTMYARCGAIDYAGQLFDTMTSKDVVLYTAILAAYTQKAYIDEALRLFIQMQHQGVKPNQFTYPTVLSACASLASPEVGKQVHSHIIKMGVMSDVFVGNGLVDMYAKCGNIENARQTFDRIPKHDIVLWNVMIAGYVQHEYAEAALQVFEEMQQFGIKPNHITFVSVLSACSQLGLVGLGRRIFDSLTRVYGIIPSMEHYICMIKLLGSAGSLYEAEDFIKNLPIEQGTLIKNTLLHARRNNENRLSDSFSRCNR
ncbi:pentatricopeptide repeat-containing protein At2g33680 [Cryptomeria japonica]|uniref:pentatricopeptide repeat-containing protein At2g33680 n=1 Tax=Cryptomeria japonica TaxID=3369 RepID=UPI0027DA5385|nr:pentatricopeptide repeat-containing protein At2g33680 [Cryptomeria japonica]